MAVTNYYTVNGKIRGEGTAAGGFRPYGHDALGSVVATYDSTGSLENTYRNAPYGTQVAKTGTAADPRFLYNGGSGYRTTGRNYSPYYVRKRHLDNKTAQWTTVDPLWQRRVSCYVYCKVSPLLHTDPTGLEDLLGVIRRLISRGMLPGGDAGRYQHDNDFAEDVHRELGRLKRGLGPRRNPDADDEMVKDAVEAAGGGFNQSGSESGGESTNYWALGGAAATVVALGLIWVFAPEAGPICTAYALAP